MSGAYSARRRALNWAYAVWPKATDACAYCGLVADTYDHVPPLSLVHALGREHFESRRIALYLVPACRECNSCLSSVPHTSVLERRAHMKRVLRRRYAKVLRMPRWSEEEMVGLGRGLVDMIRGANAVRELTKRRIEW